MLVAPLVGLCAALAFLYGIGEIGALIAQPAETT
jgi:hypothetical protein